LLFRIAPAGSDAGRERPGESGQMRRRQFYIERAERLAQAIATWTWLLVYVRGL
jgi:hypothetical protein